MRWGPEDMKTTQALWGLLATGASADGAEGVGSLGSQRDGRGTPSRPLPRSLWSFQEQNVDQGSHIRQCQAWVTFGRTRPPHPGPASTTAGWSLCPDAPCSLGSSRLEGSLPSPSSASSGTRGHTGQGHRKSYPSPGQWLLSAHPGAHVPKAF